MRGKTLVLGISLNTFVTYIENENLLVIFFTSYNTTCPLFFVNAYIAVDLFDGLLIAYVVSGNCGYKFTVTSFLSVEFLFL